MRVELYTRDGGFVVAAVLPLWGAFPDVLLWGERVFVIDGEFVIGERVFVIDGDGEPGRYREAFAFAVLPQMESS